MKGVTRSHTTPVIDFERFAESEPGTVVWEEGNRRVMVAHIPNPWAQTPSTELPILAFQAILGRTYMGTFTSLEEAIAVLGA
jgi:hypothetical protein